MKRQIDSSGFSLSHHADQNNLYAIKDDQIAQSTIYAQTMASGFIKSSPKKESSAKRANDTIAP
jgi:hypothetical protein